MQLVLVIHSVLFTTIASSSTTSPPPIVRSNEIRARLDEACRKHGFANRTDSMRDDIFVDKKHKLAFCKNPKVG